MLGQIAVVWLLFQLGRQISAYRPCFLDDHFGPGKGKHDSHFEKLQRVRGCNLSAQPALAPTSTPHAPSLQSSTRAPESIGC